MFFPQPVKYALFDPSFSSVRVCKRIKLVIYFVSEQLEYCMQRHAWNQQRRNDTGGINSNSKHKKVKSFPCLFVLRCVRRYFFGYATATFRNGLIHVDNRNFFSRDVRESITENRQHHGTCRCINLIIWHRLFWGLVLTWLSWYQLPFLFESKNGIVGTIQLEEH